MKHRHIAFCILPNHPHVGPTLPIVSVLVRRGNRVTYATSDRFLSRVADCGAEVRCFDWRASPSVDESWSDRVARRITDQLRELTSFYKDDKPDLIVYDEAGQAGFILAREWSVPAIYTGPSFAHDRNLHCRQVPNPRLRQSMLEAGRLVDHVLERFGVCGSDWLFHREKLNIYLCPRALQPCPETIDDSCFYAGRCAGEQPYYGFWKRPETSGRPIALVATSTNYIQGSEYFKICIEALSGLGWHVLLSIGDTADPASLRPLPPLFDVVQHTSHVKILPHVSLFICLGGIITSAEAAYHGVPLIVTTLGFPELEWQAENLVDLGMAVHLRKAEMSVANLRREVIEVSQDTAMLRKVERIQRMVRAEPGAEDVVNRIEEYLEQQ